jgi:threonine/homoserine/homoserine lactone efflux protein
VGGQLLAFLGVSAVVICTPGPDTALTIRNALAGGRRAGVATAAGVATGQAVWTLATGVGIAELIQASEPAFLVMRAIGAAYLIFLGLQSLAKALWSTRDPDPEAGLWTTRRRFRDCEVGLWTTRRRFRAVGLPSRLGPPHRRVAVWGGRVAVWGGRVAGRGQNAARRARVAGHGGLRPGRGLRQGVVSNLANPKMAAFFLSLLPQFASAEGGAGPVVALGLGFCLMTFAWLALYSVVVDRARVVLGRARVRRTLDGLSGLVLVGFGARLALQQR